MEIIDHQLHEYEYRMTYSSEEIEADEISEACDAMIWPLMGQYGDFFTVEDWEVENPLNPDQRVPMLQPGELEMSIFPNPDDSTWTVEDHDRINKSELSGLTEGELFCYLGMMLKQYGEKLEDYKTE